MLPTNKNGFKLLLKGLSSLAKQGNSASEVIRAVVAKWMSQCTPGLKEPILENYDLKNKLPVIEFVEWLNKSEILVASFWVSSAFAGLQEREKRKFSAMFFTPPYLSNRMLDNAGSVLFKGRIIDPACGGAAFLAPAAQRIANHLAASGNSSKEIIDYIQANLYGVDTDPFLCELSSIFMSMVLYKQIQKVGNVPTFNIRCANALTALSDEDNSFDLVLSNPPYRKMSKNEVDPLKDKYGSIMEGQPNLYSVFVKLATDLTKPKGKVVLLTPMSFLSGRSFSKLRMNLLSHGNIKQLDLIHDKMGVFLGAEQDVVITVWHNASRIGKTKVYALSRGGTATLTGNLPLSATDAPWVTPRETLDSELLPLFTKAKHNLQSYGYAPRLGAIVVHRDKRDRYANLTKSKAAKKAIPLIWQRDIGTDGKLKFDETKRLDDLFIDMGLNPTTSIIQGPAIAIQRVTSPKQTRRLICAPIPEELIAKFGGVTGENHVCFIEQKVGTPAISPEILSEILRTNTLNRLFRCISGVTNVSAYELKKLPLPDPIQVLSALNQGKSIEEAARIGFGLTPMIAGVTHG
jgi:hypothetical protein